MRTKRLWALLITFLAAFRLGAIEPPPEDQVAVQNVLKRYLTAVNQCQPEPGHPNVTQDFSAEAVGLGAGTRERLLLRPAACGANRSPMEITALARGVRAASADVILGNGFFRTISRPGGDRAGRIFVTFVRREGSWRLMDLRLVVLPAEKPIVFVEPAAQHDSSGADGWVTLFDGSNLDAFQGVNGGAVPSNWVLEDNALKIVPGPLRKGIRTRDTYRSFELRWSWKTVAKGNSGVKYRLYYLFDNPDSSDGAGHEYQLADDAGDPGAIQFPVERSASLYNQIAPQGAKPKPLGEYNDSAIVVRGRHCEHWLNGVKVLEYETESSPPESPILLQYHGTEMWFRNMRIRRLD